MEGIIPVLIAFFIVTVSPGPANIAVATVAMSQGRKRGIIFGLGLACGLSFWGVIAAAGLGAVLQASEYALLTLKILGGLYLLWLAYQSATSFSTSFEKGDVSPNHNNWFFRGLLLNVSNPKAVVAWMSALSMGLGTGDSTAHLVFVTAICMVLGIINYVGHAVLFSYSGMMIVYQKFKRWIDGVVAALFAMAGFALIRSAFSRSV